MHMFHNEVLSLYTFPVGSLGCNCSLIYSNSTKEALAVDPGNDAPAFLAKVQELGLQIKWLLHTHAHFDHIGASWPLKQQLGCSTALHKGDDFLYKLLPEQGRLFGCDVGPTGPIDCDLEDLQTFGLEHTQDPSLREFLKTIHTPGHTPGSCSFYTEALGVPVLLSGDTLFAHSVGRTDLPGGDFSLIAKSIKQRLYTLPDDTTCIPGHGPVTMIFKEKRSNPFVHI